MSRLIHEYRSHLYRKHGVDVDDDEHNSTTENRTLGIDDASFQHPDDETMEQPTADTTTDKQRAAALFILKAKEERMLTQNAVSGLLKDVTGNTYIL